MLCIHLLQILVLTRIYLSNLNQLDHFLHLCVLTITSCSIVFSCILLRTIRFLNEAAVRVHSTAIVLLLGLLLTQPQDVLQSIESYLDDLGVHHSEQITQRLNAAQVHQVPAHRQLTV